MPCVARLSLDDRYVFQGRQHLLIVTVRVLLEATLRTYGWGQGLVHHLHLLRHGDFMLEPTLA